MVSAADSWAPFFVRWLFRLIDFPVWILFPIAIGEFPWWTAIFLFGGIGCLIVVALTAWLLPELRTYRVEPSRPVS